MEMVEKEGDQMESKTSKERWIYATAELYGVSVEDIHAILDQCKEFYGNKLDFEQQKNYVRGVLDKVAPMKYFQFTGHAGEAGFREKPNGGYKQTTNGMNIFHNGLEAIAILLMKMGEDLVT